jgi:hypothetical protein
MNNRLWYFVPALVCTLGVVGLSVAPGKSLPHFTLWDILSADKIGHCAAYGAIVMSWLWGVYRFKHPLGVVTVRHKTWIVVGAVMLGVLMEWVQGTFFPDRFLELADMIANTVGAFVGLVIANRWMAWSHGL